MKELTPIPAWQDWLLEHVFAANRAYFWLLMALGFFVCVCLAKKEKRSGYLLIAIFFLAPVFALILRALSHRIHPELYQASPAAHDTQISKAQMWSVTTKISFPLFETFLVAGLILLLRKKKEPNQSPEPTAPSGRGSP